MAGPSSRTVSAVLVETMGWRLDEAVAAAAGAGVEAEAEAEGPVAVLLVSLLLLLLLPLLLLLLRGGEVGTCLAGAGASGDDGAAAGGAAVATAAAAAAVGGDGLRLGFAGGCDSCLGAQRDAARPRNEEDDWGAILKLVKRKRGRRRFGFTVADGDRKLMSARKG